MNSFNIEAVLFETAGDFASNSIEEEKYLKKANHKTRNIDWKCWSDIFISTKSAADKCIDWGDEKTKQTSRDTDLETIKNDI